MSSVRDKNWKPTKRVKRPRNVVIPRGVDTTKTDDSFLNISINNSLEDRINALDKVVRIMNKQNHTFSKALDQQKLINDDVAQLVNSIYKLNRKYNIVLSLMILISAYILGWTIGWAIGCW